MVGKILIDTNVLLDYLLEREPFFEDAKKVILSCIKGLWCRIHCDKKCSGLFYIRHKGNFAK